MTSAIVQEIVDFLLVNNGPLVDEKGHGRGHPTKKRLECSDLEEAISLAESKGFAKGWKPYHFYNCMFVWNNQEYVNTVLVKKVEQLLAEKYHGDIVELITHVSKDELLSPLKNTLGGKIVDVSLTKIGTKLKSSPFEMISKYLKLRNRNDVLSELKPYHFSRASQCTYEDSTVNEVLVNKINQLLKENYNGDLFDLITNVTIKELKSPLKETLTGKDINVKMLSVCKKLRCSPFDIVCRYLELNNQVDILSELRPYHLSQASRGTYDNEANVNEVLVKKIDKLLIEDYSGDLFEFITKVSQDELMNPLKDTFMGQKVNVPMKIVGKKFRCSPFDMICRYLTLKNRSDVLSELKPYYLNQTTHGTYDNQSNVNEILVKKIDQLLQETYHGDLFELITNITQDELHGPLKTMFIGRKINVPMGHITDKFENSPFKMICRYLAVKNRTDVLSELKPYHLSRTANRTYNDESVVDEVLIKKVTQLLKEKYHGDLFELIADVTRQDLMSPLNDTLLGRPIEVSLGTVGNKLNCSTFEMLRHYFKLNNKPFPYTKACFIGSPDTRKRRISGELSCHDLVTIKRSGEYDTSLFGFRVYNGEDKDITREVITEYFMDKIGEVDASYLGLESEQFVSLKWFSEFLNYDPSKSTVIERDERVYNAMKATQEHATNGMKRTLKGLELKLGDFDKEVEKLEHPYNLVNFDTCGHFSLDKARSLNTLFGKNLFADQAVLYVTLDNSPLAQERAKAIFNADQVGKLNDCVTDAAKTNGYEIRDKFSLDYKGGTNGNSRDMLVLGFFVEKPAMEATI